MLEELMNISMKNIKKRLPICITFIIILFGITISGLITLIKGPVELNSLAFEDLPNSYVTTNVTMLVDIFAEDYIKYGKNTEISTKKFYILPIGDKEYIGLKISRSDFELANKIYNATYKFLGKKSRTLPYNLKVNGTVHKMNSKIYKYYLDWFKTSGLLENPTEKEIKKVALPYVIEVDSIGHIRTAYLFILLAGLNIILIYITLILIKGTMGAYQYSVRKYLKTHPEITQEQMEADYAESPKYEDFRIGKILTYYFKHGKTCIVENSNIIWAYLEECTYQTFTMKQHTSYSLYLYTKDKKRNKCIMKHSYNVNSALTFYAENHPHIKLGYSNELLNMYQNNFDDFMKSTVVPPKEATSDENTEQSSENMEVIGDDLILTDYKTERSRIKPPLKKKAL